MTDPRALTREAVAVMLEHTALASEAQAALLRQVAREVREMGLPVLQREENGE